MDKKIVIATHDGMFHSDDVFAVAALLIMLDGAPVVTNIMRTRETEAIVKADFVVDVGGEYSAEKNRFDHHQIGGAGARENTVPYASFGLVWKKFGTEITGEVSGAVDRHLVSAIDAHDSGVDLYTKTIPSALPYLVDQFVHNLRPTWE